MLWQEYEEAEDGFDEALWPRDPDEQSEGYPPPKMPIVGFGIQAQGLSLDHQRRMVVATPQKTSRSDSADEGLWNYDDQEELGNLLEKASPPPKPIEARQSNDFSLPVYGKASGRPGKSEPIRSVRGTCTAHEVHNLTCTPLPTDSKEKKDKHDAQR